MTESLPISLDAMSGDEGPDIVMQAAVGTLNRFPDVEFLVVGDERRLAAALAKAGSGGERISIRHASEIVTMEDSARDAIRRKKDSSMRVAIDLVAEGNAAACVSAGNTGALMATAKFVLKTIPGIDRPAIMSEMPSDGGPVYMLDLGANANSSPQQLLQFALMGSVVAHDITGIESPRVGLLNIGEEQSKGDETVREAAGLLSESPDINYVGFVEGTDIFHAGADVIVTDGFTGNVALKTMEGTADYIARSLKKSFTASPLAKLQALIAAPVLRSFRASIDPRHYNGATLIGLNGVVIKSHGGADAVAFRHAIETAIIEVKTGVSKHIGQLLERQ